MVHGRSDGQALPDDPETDLDSQYWLKVGNRELPLDEGETLIGRGDACRVVVNEAMVSRRHARIIVAGARPYIEDLGSANGTFVNQTRVRTPIELSAGDRIFVGTCEIEVVRRVYDGDRATMPVLEPELDRPTPASGVGAYAPTSGGRTTTRRRRAADGNPAMTEAEEFESLAHLADKMFTMGRVDAAMKILEEPLEQVLVQARCGSLPGPALLDLVGRYAVKLATELLEARWVDLAIETHLLAVRPLREETIQQLASLRAREPIGSDELIARYYERLRGSMGSFSAAERILSERAACLLPALGAR